LREDPKWTRASILQAIEKPVEKTISLPVPVPVHILYWTAWVNEDGSLEFRDDIYGRDKRLLEVFVKTAPKAEKP
ncbi:MAG: peptidoglycan-binding protein, partial [Candidatus Margulisiibacteriota bacterium]